ncbi:hypothetical protein L6164_030101 [Bauhinia variegata]|uniref:Uncharacterized protein n=1 Tax=Bauhinia variegata TaxID=167791 RepID=A0ACB9LB44_BAUVA|nr:hypothetical protein L6164_030101 [Bauhinia variegata]
MASTRVISFVLVLSFACFLSLPISTTASKYNISAVFAFGDSTIDPGNNNNLKSTLVRADHLPYGRDLPNHVPTGRFCNGKLSTDFLVSKLGIKDLLPAYLDPKLTDNDLLTGVSFASAGSGLDNHTIALTKVIDLPTQFQSFEQALTRISKLVGDEKTRHIVENALFVISIGSNDMMFNVYLLPTRNIEFNISGYQDLLLHNLNSFIERLYQAGARKIVVAGLPPIGCLPVLITAKNIFPPNPRWLHRECKEDQNRDSQAYNSKLTSRILPPLRAGLQGAKIGYFDIYTPIFDMVTNPAKYGFDETHQGCCGTGHIEMGPLCNVLDPICPDASKYLFWDAVHPTQAAYSVLADYGLKTLLPYLNN